MFRPKSTDGYEMNGILSGCGYTDEELQDTKLISYSITRY